MNVETARSAEQKKMLKEHAETGVEEALGKKIETSEVIEKDDVSESQRNKKNNEEGQEHEEKNKKKNTKKGMKN